MNISFNYSKKDYTEAAKWYRKAADQRDARAQCYLGGRNRSRRVTFFFPVYPDCAELINCFMAATVAKPLPVNVPCATRVD